MLAASLVGKSSAPALQPVQSGKDDFKNTSLSLMRNGGPPKVGGITYPPAKKLTFIPATNDTSEGVGGVGGGLQQRVGG